MHDVRAQLVRRRLRARSLIAGGIAVALTISLIPVLIWVGRAVRPPAHLSEAPNVGVRPVEPDQAEPDEPPSVADRPRASWPTPGTADVTATRSDAPAGAVTAAGKRGTKAGDLPVWVGLPGAADSTERLRVSILDRQAAAAAGVRGLVLSVEPVAGQPRDVAVTVDYSAFRTAFGADWSSRLGLVALPRCALTTPQRRGCARQPIDDSHNNPGSGVVSATVDLGGGMAFLSLEAGPSGPAGDYSATQLQPSSTWTAGGSSGNFAWSYPMRTPPAVAGPQANVELAYSSQAVDGRHAASNNQPSQVGEGFELSAGGFIERRYKSCAEDMGSGANNSVKTGDQCWATDNAVLSMAGRSGELLWDAASGRWRLRGDDGSRVQRLTGAGNGDNDGEYWVVTTTDGVQYWFGAHKLPGWTSGDPVTNSVYTVPVFGNHSGEPCHASSFASSSCAQAWRWNLDYVVDLHGNSMSYWYVQETNKYGRNNDPDDDVTYVRGGWLEKILYGTRHAAGVESALDANAPAKVVFEMADRCLADCANHESEAAWPDTPWDQECSGSTCSLGSPTFWSSRRLASVTTQILGVSGYEDIERWTFTHTFPDPGDTTRAGLWLQRISHTGLRGGTVALPDITFTGVALNNRVDSAEGIPAMNWWRISRIDTETGGVIAVTYSPQECDAGDPMPAPENNTKRCYPVMWIPDGQTTAITDWFHKYVVTEVREDDTTGGNPEVVHTYTYLDGAAWHYTDDDGLVKPEYKTWSDWRGYGRVGVTVGEDPLPGQRDYTETRFFRGMHGDKQPSGVRTVTLPATGNAPAVNDEDWWAGMVRETTTFNGPGGAVVGRTISQPWASAATATRSLNGTVVTARFIGTEYTWKHTSRDGGRPDRIAKTANTFDSHGMIVAAEDLGEDGVSGDETCTTTTYEPRNTTDWITGLPHRTRSFAVDCAAAATPTSLGDADVISDVRTFYDNHAHGVAPTLAETTKIEKMATYNAGNPTWVTVNTYQYDVHGRVVQARDALNNLTTTSYAPSVGGPVTGNTVTNALNHVTVTTIDPAFGVTLSVVDPNLRRIDRRYDALGRLTGVWLADRDVGADTPSIAFSYTLQATAASYVTTQRLDPTGAAYLTTYEIYDALLRPVQTQKSSPTGGRLLTNTFYDKLGRKVETYETYASAGSPSGTLVVPVDPHDVPSQNRTIYDGAGRVTAEIFEAYDVERWRTTKAYGGDRTDVTPPQGGVATSTIVDVRGHTAQLRQYHDPVDVGSENPAAFDLTTYAYDRKSQLTQVTDPAGNSWLTAYDLRGRVASETDPDRGTTTYAYDNADRRTSATDGRGVKLVYTYDALNRMKAVYQNVAVGTPRAAWTYDTLAKGKLYQSVRNSAGSSYVSRVTGYTDNYEITGQQYIVPVAETGLAGTYTYSYTYNADGSRATTTLPAIGGLPAETLHHNYDALGLPSTLTGVYGATSLHYVADSTYNALGQLDAYTLDTDPFVDTNDQVEIAWSRELETGRLTQLYVGLTGAPYVVTDQRYSYDDAGNVTSINDLASSPDDTQCFEYDYLRRLTDAWTPASGDCDAAPATAGLGGPAPYWHSWTYDLVGNRLTETLHAAGGNTTTSYSYPAAGGARPHTVTQTSTTVGAGAPTVVNYSYDNAGNTTTRPLGAATQTLTWDAEGQLATTSGAGGGASYLYDADGGRLLSRDATGKTLYLPGQELRHTTASGATAGTRYYIHGEKLIASRTSAGLTWLATDHQGTQAVAIDQATLAVTQRRQNPFGQARGAVASWPNPHGFVNGVADPTGLTHLGAREYDPAIGRFISDDPVTDVNDPQQINGYSYANNTPITMSDPDGRRPCEGADDCTEKASNATTAADTAIGTAVGMGQASAEAERGARAGDSKSENILKFLRKHPVLWTIAKFGSSKWGKGLGRATVVLGFGLSIASHFVDGDDPFTATGKAVVETGFAMAGAALFATAGGICGPAVVVCAPVFGAAGGFAGGWFGGVVNDYVLEPLGAWDATAAAWEWSQPYIDTAIDKTIEFVTSPVETGREIVEQAREEWDRLTGPQSPLLPWNWG